MKFKGVSIVSAAVETRIHTGMDIAVEMDTDIQNTTLLWVSEDATHFRST